MLNTNVRTPNWLREMEAILEELNEGVVIVDDKLRVIFANEALIRMGQYDRGEIEGCTPDALFPSEDLPVIQGLHESDHQYGRSRNEFYLPRKDGVKIPAIFSGRVIQGPDRQDYVLVTITDISAQKRIEKQLRASNTLLEERQMEIQADLSLAASVQKSLVPQNLTWNDVSIETYYSPAHTIGGDFGVVSPDGDGRLHILMCDVSGHGIGSALMANRIYSETLHQLERKIGPGSMLRHLHDFVHDRLAIDGFYFTMAAVRLSHNGRHASFTAAGHPPAMLVSKGGVRLLESQNGILGCLSGTAPTEGAEELELASGDRLILYTDGLTEVFNDQDEMFGVEGLETLVRLSAKLPLPEMRQAIIDGVTEWGHGALTDDVSLVIVEVH